MGAGLTWFLYGIFTQLRQIGPWWLAGMIAGSLISVYLSDKIAKAFLRFRQDKFCFGSLFLAAVLGAASPVCLFGTIPLIAALGRKGVAQHILVTFMISSILLNPNLFIFSFALGVPLALSRLFMSLAAGMAAGLLARLFLRKQQVFRFERFDVPEIKKKTFRHDLVRSFQVTAPYFFVGIVLTAIFDQYFPKEYIALIFGENKGLGILFATSLSIPVYVCGGGTIPLISAWLRAGMSTGSAIAFMAAGPATKITNLGAIKIVLGMRKFLLYLAYCLIFAILSGLAADLVFQTY